METCSFISSFFQGEISDANQIFKELAVLVHSQGEIVDSIEAHVENTGINVQQGANHLREASRLSVSDYRILFPPRYKKIDL